jgi:hypothetical protein
MFRTACGRTVETLRSEEHRSLQRRHSLRAADEPREASAQERFPRLRRKLGV